MDLTRYVETLNLLGDESRLRLCALLRDRELSVGDLVRVTGISQPRVSTHLARLREGGFVRDRREGQNAFYALSLDNLTPTARNVLDDAARSTDATLEGDRARLADLDREARGAFPDAFAGRMDFQYSPGRTWQSLAVGLAALLDLGDVLDVGSGDGSAAAYLARVCRSLVCVDSSARMVEAAQTRFAGEPHVTAQMGDVHELPFGESSFDAVVLFHTLTYAEDPPRAVAECSRVLRPGGRLVVLSLDRHEQSDVTARYGERHPGFTPKSIRTLLTRAGLVLSFCDVACRETKKPHFQVVLAVGEKPNSKTITTSKSG